MRISSVYFLSFFFIPDFPRPNDISSVESNSHKTEEYSSFYMIYRMVTTGAAPGKTIQHIREDLRERCASPYLLTPVLLTEAHLFAL